MVRIQKIGVNKIFPLTSVEPPSIVDLQRHCRPPTTPQVSSPRCPGRLKSRRGRVFPESLRYPSRPTKKGRGYSGRRYTQGRSFDEGRVPFLRWSQRS